jgi:hypothetical protein
MYATATKQAKKVAEGTAEDALAMVRASVAKKHGAASIVGSPENKAAQAAQKKPTGLINRLGFFTRGYYVTRSNHRLGNC